MTAPSEQTSSPRTRNGLWACIGILCLVLSAVLVGKLLVLVLDLVPAGALAILNPVSRWLALVFPTNFNNGIGNQVRPELIVTYWLVIAIVYGWTCRRELPKWSLVYAPFVIIVFTIVLQFLLTCVGYNCRVQMP